MDNNVINQTRVLNEEIKNCDTYRKYRYCYDQLKTDPETFRQVKDFLRKNFRIQCTSDCNTIDDVDKLREEYRAVLEKPIVMEFLGAEQSLIRLLRQVEEDIFNGIELDVTAIEEA